MITWCKCSTGGFYSANVIKLYCAAEAWSERAEEPPRDLCVIQTWGIRINQSVNGGAGL